MDEKLIEAIKTLNLNFDGNLNSETLQQLAETLSPYITWWLVRGFLSDVLYVIVVTWCVYWVGKTIQRVWEKKCSQ